MVCVQQIIMMTDSRIEVATHAVDNIHYTGVMLSYIDIHCPDPPINKIEVHCFVCFCFYDKLMTNTEQVPRLKRQLKVL